DGAFEGIVVHRDGMILDANAAARRMFGFGDDLSKEALHEWFDVTAGWTSGDDEQTTEVNLRRPDGNRFPAEICRRRMLLADGAAGELLAVRDLTARKESEARIAHLALHDPLTELPNRRFFMELAHKTIAHAQRAGDRFALLALDLDDFKLVNDMYGHAAGDALLGVTAQRISATLRESDVCARFGGDEFAILESYTAEPNDAIALAERLLEVLHTPVFFDGVEIPISVSIGVALFPDDGSTVEELLRNADTAMYRAKADGKATCRFFEPQMDAALVARRRLEQRLRRAVAEDRLSVAYQPIVDSDHRAPLAFEALLRWTDEELGTVTPAEFIPVAEETGLIVPLGEFVLRRACGDATQWPSPIRVAVNLSAVQFRRRGLVDTVRSALADSGLPGDRLELEVTETLLMENREDALRQLNDLKQLGVRISMDDFGTGYSSLSYLQCFPFDKIKIDRAFVSDLPDNAQNASIVRAVAAMGKSLDMRVVAEGVETNLQADILKGLECDEIQGFLIARPMRVNDIAAFLGGQVASRPALVQEQLTVA
ncbi:MAG: putative bifunctional diguanylate cyclase/phosphodiesterase, partial [Longimicrobiales bacterium]